MSSADCSRPAELGFKSSEDQEGFSSSLGPLPLLSFSTANRAGAATGLSSIGGHMASWRGTTSWDREGIGKGNF